MIALLLGCVLCTNVVFVRNLQWSVCSSIPPWLSTW